MQQIKERSIFIQVVDTALKPRKEAKDFKPIRDEAASFQNDLIELIVARQRNIIMQAEVDEVESKQ